MNKRGYIILEAMLAITVFAMVVLSVIPMISFLLKREARSRYEARASALLQEGMEATYNIFISNWSAYPIDNIYHPGKSASGRWVLFTGEQTNLETIFKRSITVEKACRNPSGKILEKQNGVCGNNIDPDSRFVTTKISWSEEGNLKTLEAKMLLVNLNE